MLLQWFLHGRQLSVFLTPSGFHEPPAVAPVLFSFLVRG